MRHIVRFFAIFTLLVAGTFEVSARTTPNTKETEAARAALRERIEDVRSTLGVDVPDVDPKTGLFGQVAQWFNWPNWRNWPNWPNWQNWRNW